MLFLREALRNNLCPKALRHLPKLSRTAVMMATDRRLFAHVTPRLLKDAVEADATVACPHEEGWQPDAYRLMLDTVKMAQVLEWNRCPRTFSSLALLRRVHDELAPRIEVSRLKDKYNLPDRFADPPFEGTADIVPLMTPEDLFQEGTAQRNCAGVHALHVAQGREFVYRVERPVRATLAVVRLGGKWVADEFYKARNEPVEEDVRREVFERLFASRRNRGAVPDVTDEAVAV